MNVEGGSVRSPWWLERGDTICVTCADAFHSEATVRCRHCDACVCASCVVEARGEDGALILVCHACAEVRG